MGRNFKEKLKRKRAFQEKARAATEFYQLVRQKKSNAKRETQKTSPVATATNSVLSELGLSEISFSSVGLICWV